MGGQLCLVILAAPSNPENGWKDPHEAMPMVGDAASFAWLRLLWLVKYLMLR